jgi:hypothetical protein
LERFSHEKSKIMVRTLTELLAGVGHRNIRRGRTVTDSNMKFQDILRILWYDVVKPVVEGLSFQVYMPIVPPVFAADIPAPDRIGSTSPYLVVCNWAAHIPTHSCRWAVRYTRNRRESLRLYRFLLYPYLNHHTRTIRPSGIRRLSTFDSSSTIRAKYIGHSQRGGRGSNRP